jgi:hypothetical protein
MNDERQLPLIKRFMLRVAPEVCRYRFNWIAEETQAELCHESPTWIADQTLAISVHLAAAYARCYDQLSKSEKNPPAPCQQEAADPAECL